MLRTLPNRRSRTATAAFALLLAPSALAQLATLSEFTDELNRAGFGIYGLSVFGIYADTRGPTINTTGQLIPDYSYHTIATGASTSLGWRTRSSSKFHFNVRLSLSYAYEISSTGFTGHSLTPGDGLTGSWSDKVAPRWNLNASLSASLGNLGQLLLSPNADQILTGTPGTAEEFGQTLLTGTSSNTELTTAANSAQSVVVGQESLLYGGFLVSASASVSASYAATPRMSISFAVSGSRTQDLPDPFEPQSPFLLNESTSVGGSVTVSYKVSERTNAFGSISYGRPISSLYTTSNVSMSGGLNRRLTEHWTAGGSVGTGYIINGNNINGNNINGNNVQGFQGLGYTASFFTGYRLQRNSFRGGVSRSVSDNYGLGSSASLAATAGWSWSAPGRHWGVSAGASWTRLEGGPYANQGYSFNVGIRDSLSRYVFASLGTAYAVATGIIGPGGIVYPRTQTETVELSLGIRPYLGSPDASRFGTPGVP